MKCTVRLQAFPWGSIFFQLILWCAMKSFADPVVQVTVNPLWAVHEQTSEIPPELFGAHAFPADPDKMADWGFEALRVINHTPEASAFNQLAAPLRESKMIMECLFDRYQPALILRDREWRTKLTAFARAYAELAKRHPNLFIEFWNEPYLNWACKPGVNYDGAFFDQTVIQPGQPARVLTTGEIFPNVVWRQKPRLVVCREKDDGVDYVATRYAAFDYARWGRYRDGETWKPFRWEEGFRFRFRGIPCYVARRWWVCDTGQKEYYSGPFNLELYARMFQVFGAEFKQRAPEARLLAGWDCNLWNNNWLPFTSLYRPLIDRCQQWMDGITEHHYGGDSRMVALEYELLYNYTLSHYGKRIKIYNTEVGGSLDPERPGVYRPNANKAIDNFTYVVRDVLCLLHFVPHQIGARMQHAPQHDAGVYAAMRFLRHLRGRLVHIQSGNPDLWGVGAVTGGKLTVYLFNDASHPAGVSLQFVRDFPVSANHPVTLVRPEVVSDKEISLVTEQQPFSVVQKQVFQLPPRGTISMTVELGKASFATASFKYHPARGHLLPMTEPVELEIPVRHRAGNDGQYFLRLALVGFSGEAPRISVNGRVLSVSPLHFPISHIPVPAEVVAEHNRVKIVPAPGTRGRLVCAAICSLEVRP
ncbi:MAG: hypothetical protein D6820_15595 [Lentisphaerae bacterium]|nr:MAG: hypothetical protein D6820_15595 [Lentisphaerota bacterium]